jgi:hypothetical protein
MNIQEDEKMTALKPLNQIIALLLLAVTASMGSASTDKTGKVTIVNINSSWGGVMFELDGVTNVPQDGCSSDQWYFFPLPSSNPDLAKSFLSSLLTARTTGESVRVGTKSCFTGSIAPIPLVDWIDFGARR